MQRNVMSSDGLRIACRRRQDGRIAATPVAGKRLRRLMGKPEFALPVSGCVADRSVAPRFDASGLRPGIQ
jgi:archaeosine-15-forming tRNA-guanine transglycosylase